MLFGNHTKTFGTSYELVGRSNNNSEYIAKFTKDVIFKTPYNPSMELDFENKNPSYGYMNVDAVE